MRSLLFVPGDSERKIAKALASGADALLLDLEDSVGLERKPAARTMTREFIAANRPKPARPRLYVRINSLETPFWEDDLAGVMSAQPDGIMLPKPRSGEDVHRLSIAMAHGEAQAGTQGGATRILPIATEMPVSILNMSSYIGSSSRLVGLTWGAEDLSAELGARTSRTETGAYTSPFQLARDLCLITAVSAGVLPVDTVYADFRDAAGFARECEAAARDGFRAKMAIHPDQVAAINQAFTPRPDEIAHARQVVDLFAANPGAGVVSHGGRMYDRPHLTLAERLLARVAALNLPA